MTTAIQKQRPGRIFLYPEENHEEFLALWPHRFDYLYAEHPHPGERPDWKTESRHPLTDRLILQGAYLYGVRFGVITGYALLDIDHGSPYHPKRDPLAIPRMQAALEEKLGIAATVPCRSSSSTGIHLYLPLNQAFKTYEIAEAVAGVLEQAGFKIGNGILEVFPNRKPFSSDGSISLYLGHRLPLQQSSYLLDADWQPVYSSVQTFTHQWRWAQAKNTLDDATLKQVLKSIRRPYRLSHKADKFLNDLNADIEPGWSDAGQTNHLLGRIAMRAHVFGHIILKQTEPLIGEALVQRIVHVARHLPGFQEFCRHVHELETRARDWARSAERHYYPYGSTKLRAAQDEDTSIIEQKPGWNQRQQQGARERIRLAVAKLLERQQLPVAITNRHQVLVACGISSTTLYKHKDLWHPGHMMPDSEEGLPPNPPRISQAGAEGERSSASPSDTQTSLLGASGCNSLFGKDHSQCEQGRGDEAGCDSPAGPAPSDCGGGIGFVRRIVAELKSRQSETTEQARSERSHAEKQRQQLALEAFDRERAQKIAWLHSGESILIGEAQLWLEQNGLPSWGE